MKTTHTWAGGSQCRAHTLIEILVVITIIGILAGLLITGVASAVASARNADAENTAHQLKNSISAYYTEYRRHPLPANTRTEKREHEDFVTNEEFMEILLGADTPTAKAANPRGTKFFSARTAKRIGPNSYVKGLALNPDGSGAGSLWDIWGRMYGVRIDTGNRGRISNPAHSKPAVKGNGAPDWGSGDSSEPKYLSESVAVWSAGKEPDRSSDNVTTWE